MSWGQSNPPCSFFFLLAGFSPCCLCPFRLDLFGVNLVMNIHENQSTMTQETPPILLQFHHAYFLMPANLWYHMRLFFRVSESEYGFMTEKNMAYHSPTVVMMHEARWRVILSE